MYLSFLSFVFRTLDLNYVTFEPMMLSRGGIMGIPLFESITETMKRAMRWLNNTNPRESKNELQHGSHLRNMLLRNSVMCRAREFCKT